MPVCMNFLVCSTSGESVAESQTQAAKKNAVESVKSVVIELTENFKMVAFHSLGDIVSCHLRITSYSLEFKIPKVSHIKITTSRLILTVAGDHYIYHLKNISTEVSGNPARYKMRAQVSSEWHFHVKIDLMHNWHIMFSLYMSISSPAQRKLKSYQWNT